MTTNTAASRTQSRLLPFQLAVAILIALKIWFDLAVDPMGDEAYYWMWGQRPALSYFDHPPLHAWLLGLTSKTLGWSPFSLRILTWVCLFGTLALFRDWARRIAPADPAGWFWRSSAVYLATPVFFAMTTVVFNDYLLVFLCALAFHFFLLFADAAEEGRAGTGWLYLAAVFLGLAGLTKYNAVFLGLGFGLFVLARPLLRVHLLRSPHIWLAGLLALALQTPVLWWNATAGMASFRFHLGTRLTGDIAHLHFWNPFDFLLSMAGLVLGPALFVALVRMLKDRSETAFESRARALGLCVFGVSSLVMLTMSLLVYVYFYWNIVGYLAVMAVAARYLGRALLRLHLAFGLVVALVVTANFTLFPVARLFGVEEMTTAANYGWPELAEAVRRERTTHPEAFLAASRYTYAAQLGFQLEQVEVLSLNPLIDQYDFWYDQAGFAGRTAIVLSDQAFPIDFPASHFDRCTLLREVPVTRFGVSVWTFQLHLCEGFAPLSARGR
jgi:4-amino-4-deoxy-L-arabinose transferase-like glycosyltransferase